jgi:hypothetical protein
VRCSAESAIGSSTSASGLPRASAEIRCRMAGGDVGVREGEQLGRRGVVQWLQPPLGQAPGLANG